MPDEFDIIKSEIDDIVAKAQEVIAPKVEPVNRVIADIKQQLAHGTDRIPTSQLHEWGLVLSVITSELTPQMLTLSQVLSGKWKSARAQQKILHSAEPSRRK